MPGGKDSARHDLHSVWSPDLSADGGGHRWHGNADLERLAAKIDQGPSGPLQFDILYRWSEAELGLEAQEMLVILDLKDARDIEDLKDVWD